MPWKEENPSKSSGSPADKEQTPKIPVTFIRSAGQWMTLTASGETTGLSPTEYLLGAKVSLHVIAQISFIVGSLGLANTLR